jgi:hypothetical protein
MDINLNPKIGTCSYEKLRRRLILGEREGEASFITM